MIPDIDKLNLIDVELAKPKPRPQFTIIYGKGKLGKTTAACYSPDPVIIPIGRETGQERMVDIGVPCFENINGINAVHFVFACIHKLLKNDHSRKTAIFDNIGTFHEATIEDVEVDYKGADLNAFGKRQALSYPYWGRLLAGFDALMKKKGMHVIFIGHDVLYNVNLPDGSYYSKIGIAAPRGENTNVAGLLEARAHNVLYMRGETRTRKVKGHMGQDKIIGTESMIKRVIYTKPYGTFFAGSRADMEAMYEIDETEEIENLLKEKNNETLIKLFIDLYK